jgi:protein O-GlcNAc transferase
VSSAAEEAYKCGIQFARGAQLEEAIASFRQAIAHDAKFAPAYANLGGTLFRMGRASEAIEPLRTAVALDAAQAGWYFNLAGAWRQVGQIDRAIDEAQAAVRIAPNFAPGHLRLGSLLRIGSRATEAVQAFRQAVSIDPNLQAAWSNLLYTLYYDPTMTPESILAEHRAWAERFAEPLTRVAELHTYRDDAGRRLRIGYVSPNLREHVTGLCVEPLLRNHDRGKFEIYCYSTGPATERASRCVARRRLARRCYSCAPDSRGSD